MKSESLIVSALAVSSFALFYYFRTPFGGDWDSYDFIWQIVTHQKSNLGFGRLYFIGIHIPIWEVAHRLFKFPATEAYKVIQFTTLILGSGTLVLYYYVVKRLLNPDAARLSAILLMTSPFYIIYAGFIMTEIPMLFFLMLGLLLLLRGIEEQGLLWTALGSAMLGVTIGIRENAVVFLPLCFVLPYLRRRNRRAQGWPIMACAIMPALLVAAAGPLWLLWRQPLEYPAYVQYWFSKLPKPAFSDYAAMLGFLGSNTFLAAPVCTVVFPAALIEAFGGWRDSAKTAVPSPKSPAYNPSPQGSDPLLKRGRPVYNATYPEILVIVILLTAIPYIALINNAEMKYYIRYTLIGLPGLALLAGLGLNNWAASVKGVGRWKYALVLAAGGWVLYAGLPEVRYYQDLHRTWKATLNHLYDRAPADAVFLPGRLTPMIEGYRQMGLRPQWEMIASGWPWPGREKLPPRVTEVFASKRPLYYVYHSATWWGLAEEQKDVESLRRQFDFQRLDDYLARLTPRSDGSSTD